MGFHISLCLPSQGFCLGLPGLEKARANSASYFGRLLLLGLPA
jgi:hypothetical protein